MDAAGSSVNAPPLRRSLAADPESLEEDADDDCIQHNAACRPSVRPYVGRRSSSETSRSRCGNVERIVRTKYNIREDRDA